MLTGAVFLRVCHKAGGVDHRPVRLETLQFLCGRAYKHIVSKKVGPGIFIDHPNPHPILQIRTDETIADIEFLFIQVTDNFLVQPVKSFGFKGLVDRPPPYLILAYRILYDKPVLRRSAGKLSCVYSQSPGVRLLAHSGLKGLLVKLVRRQLVVNVFCGDSIFSQRNRFRSGGRCTHKSGFSLRKSI